MVIRCAWRSWRNYFVAPDVVAEARGAKAGVVGESRSPHEVGLEEQVELLRRQAEADRRPSFPTWLPSFSRWQVA